MVLLIQFHEFWRPRRDRLFYTKVEDDFNYSSRYNFDTNRVLHNVRVIKKYAYRVLYREILLYFNIPFPGINHKEMIK